MNIKGHCKIELTDVKTGRKEVEEHDNMLTKALYYFYDQAGMTNPSAFNASAIRTDALNQLLGGVMCLDTALTESDEIVRVPAGVGMTANGARGVLNSGNPTELGSYNEIESGWQQDGSFKMVWDWTTSQGNGTIACVGLSSLYGGMKGIGNKSLTNKSNPFNSSNYNSLVGGIGGIVGIVLGYKNNKIYAVESIYGVTEWTINVYDAQFTTIDIRDTMTARLIESKTCSIPASIQNLVERSGGAGMGITVNQDGDICTMFHIHRNTNNIYWHMEFTGERPAFVIKYDIANNTCSVQELNPTNTGISISPTSEEGFYYGASKDYAIIANNLIDLSNLANVSTIDNLSEKFHVQYTDPAMRAITADTFFSDIGNMQVDADVSKAYPCNGGQISGSNMAHNPLLRFAGSAVYRDFNYLATIYNLQTPVVKDGSKTMKVTYILRFS
jgi:hypothetical protein